MARPIKSIGIDIAIPAKSSEVMFPDSAKRSIAPKLVSEKTIFIEARKLSGLNFFALFWLYLGGVFGGVFGVITFD